MTIKCTTLKNGIRVITDERKDARAVSICVSCHYGASHETAAEKGITHVMEHMLFMGTRKKIASEIESTLADMGAIKDGLTGSYYNYYPIRVLKESAEAALDIWSEILQESIFDPGKFDTEKQVVLREIDMVLDNPNRKFGELWLKTAYPKANISYSSAGTKENVKAFTVERVKNHWKKIFANNLMVIAAQGGISHQRFVKLCEKKFTKWAPKGKASLTKEIYKGGLKHAVCKQNQEWLFVGFESPKYFSKDAFATELIEWILAKGFSSKLYRSVRGKGLAYRTERLSWVNENLAISGVFLQVSPENLYGVIQTVIKECSTFANTVTSTELKRAQKQIISRLLLMEDSISHNADYLACFPLQYLKLLPVEQRIKAYKSVSLTDIKRVAKEMFAGAPTVAIMGPKCKTPTYKTICKWLKG
ncbi:MAG: insulinase family protein [Alphaproteobacteria bacterium]|nr:insulinase family protein [Alphaproteobacteria bacterium]